MIDKYCSCLLHASTVSVDGAGVVLRGPAGAGKSTLAVQLIDQGGVLVADDATCLERKAGQTFLTARSPATITGLMEVRGYGIVRLPTAPETSVRLIVDLADADGIERLPEERTEALLGCDVPRAFIDPTHPSACARIRVILKSLMPFHPITCRTMDVFSTGEDTA